MRAPEVRSPRVALVDGSVADSVSPWELGLLLGNGAFETLRSAGPGVRALALHLRRLDASLAALGLEAVDQAVLGSEVQRARAAIAGDALLRVIVAKGERGPIRLVLAEPHTFSAVGDVVAITVTSRRPMPRAKLTSYGVCWAAIAEATRQGATEALLVDDGTVTEGATSSVFAVDGETLVTAPDDGVILAGVTRQLVLELARGHGVAVRFERPSLALLRSGGGFVTSTKRGVAALGRLDGAGLPIPPIAAKMRALYEASLTSSASNTG